VLFPGVEDVEGQGSQRAGFLAWRDQGETGPHPGHEQSGDAGAGEGDVGCEAPLEHRVVEGLSEPAWLGPHAREPAEVEQHRGREPSFHSGREAPRDLGEKPRRRKWRGAVDAAVHRDTGISR